MNKSNGYGSTQKLKSRKAMETLFAAGKTLNAFPIKVFYTLDPVTQNITQTVAQIGASANLLHAGVGVSSRNFKKAVDRNRIKRLLREVYRTQNQLLVTTVLLQAKELNVFFLYVGKELPEYTDLKIAMEKVLAKLNDRIIEISKQ